MYSVGGFFQSLTEYSYTKSRLGLGAVVGYISKFPLIFIFLWLIATGLPSALKAEPPIVPAHTTKGFEVYGPFCKEPFSALSTWGVPNQPGYINEKFAKFQGDPSDFVFTVEPVKSSIVVEPVNPGFHFSPAPRRYVTLYRLEMASKNSKFKKDMYFEMETQGAPSAIFAGYLRGKNRVPAEKLPSIVLDALHGTVQQKLSSLMQLSYYQTALENLGIDREAVEERGTPGAFPGDIFSALHLMELIGEEIHTSETRSKVVNGALNAKGKFIGAHGDAVLNDPFNYQLLPLDGDAGDFVRLNEDGSRFVKFARRMGPETLTGKKWTAEGVTEAATQSTIDHGDVVLSQKKRIWSSPVETRRLRVMVHEGKAYGEANLPEGVKWNLSSTKWWEVDTLKGKVIRSEAVLFKSKSQGSTLVPPGWTAQEIEDVTLATAALGRSARTEVAANGNERVEKRLVVWRDEETGLLQTSQTSALGGVRSVRPPRNANGDFAVPVVEWIVQMEDGTITAGYPDGNTPTDFTVKDSRPESLYGKRYSNLFVLDEHVSIRPVLGIE